VKRKQGSTESPLILTNREVCLELAAAGYATTSVGATAITADLALWCAPSSIMFEAAVKAREGDVAYFQSLTPVELTSLLVGRDEDGRTLFHTAAAEGHLELLNLLIAAGSAKVSNKHDDEVTAGSCMQVTGQHTAPYRLCATTQSLLPPRGLSGCQHLPYCCTCCTPSS
jgi:hypothetical protein